MNNLTSVLYAEKNTIAELANDPDYLNGTQWHLNNDGRNGGVIGADINADDAWSVFTGNSAMSIAIFDTGVESDHDELIGRVTGDSPINYYHGTAVAGVAAASGNNGIGGRGLDWETQILSKRIFDVDTTSQDWINYRDWAYVGDVIVAEKIIDAVDAGAQILNHSWRGINYSSTLASSFAYAYKMNRVSVASMGNDQSPVVKYPAGFTNVISVGATTNTDVRSFWSNTGNHIDVVAPGGIDDDITNPENIYTTSLNNDYLFTSGTSFSAPAVTGLASLLKGYDNNLSNDDITNIVRLSADEVFGMNGQEFTNEYGYGRINAGGAFDFLLPPYSLKNWTANGGNVYSTSDSYVMTILGASELSSGSYIVKRREVRKAVTFPESFCEVEGSWGRGVFSNGWNQINPNYGEGFCEIVPGTLTNTGATYRTYVYEVWNLAGQYYGYYPTTPLNVTFSYAVLGVPNPTLIGPNYICASIVTEYSIMDLPIGSSVIWETSSNIDTVSTTMSQCYVESDGIGPGWVRVTISGICDTIILTKNVDLSNEPTNVQIHVPVEPIYGEVEAMVWASSDPGEESYDWQVSGGTIISESGSEMTLIADCPSRRGITIGVKAINECGESAWVYRNVEIDCTGGINPLSILPNPADGYVDLTIDQTLSESVQYYDGKYEISVLDQSGILKFSTITFDTHFRINTQSFIDGIYYVILKYAGKRYGRQLIISH